MNEISSHGGGPRDTAMRISCVALAAVAGAQIAAAALVRSPRDAAQEVAVTVRPPHDTSEIREYDPFADPLNPPPDPYPEMNVPPGEPPPVPDPAVPEPPHGRTLPARLDVPITNAECLEHLEEGLYLASQGDTLQAVKRLREALRLQPDHPMLLYNLAKTLELMGQREKALVQWSALRRLGPDAGDYYLLAIERLKEYDPDLAEAVAAEDAAEIEPEGRFVAASVESVRPPAVEGGEVISFKVRLERRQPEPVTSPEDILLAIHFFDSVNGRRIARTTALKPEILPLDSSVDWRDGAEEFIFEYRQPPMTPDEIIRFGQRKYYGYVLEVYYQNRLQDVKAEPPQLTAFARELPVEEAPPEDGEPQMDGMPGRGLPVLQPGDLMPPSLFPPEITPR